MIDPQLFLNPSKAFIHEIKNSIESEQDYHDSIPVSQTDLKKLARGPRYFREAKLKREEEEEPYVDMNKYLKMGTMVEQKLLEPERFEENFIEQAEMETPSSPNQKEFVKLILSGEYGMVEAHNKAYANSNPSKASKLYESLEKYINFQSESQGKGVYSQDEKETLLRVTGDIMSHNKASRLLLEDSVYENTWTQLPLFAEINNVFVKGLIDRLVQINEDHFYLIDLKTTSKPLSNFGYHFLRRKYYIQLAMYTRLFTYHMRETYDINAKVKQIVIASHTQEPYDTVVRAVPFDLISKGADAIEDLTDRLKWHINEEKWDRRKDYYDTNLHTLEYDSDNIPEMNL